ncbi:MAG: hypothetical protein CSA86_02165 [Arcobacter sp.]|nr:MAG: hypothetical protein CSA86_02165 [Arcobacter sp.]
MKKTLFVIALLVGLVSQGFTQPVVPKGDFSKKLKKASGEPGKFVVGKDNFPKSYFLVHKNLPFLAGLSLHHPKSSSLGLSKKQIDAILEIKKRTVPAVIKAAKKIKKLELQLAQNIAIESNSAKSQYQLVEEIGQLRTQLTKAHLQCINEVRAVLSKEQYKILLSYATKMSYKAKSSKFKIDELVILPHPGKFIKLGKVNVTKDQKNRIEKEVKAVYAPIFQDKIREAYTLETKVQRMVAKGKTKKDLKDLLDQISQLKREAIDSRIDALNHMKKILNKKQWEQINKLTYR